MYEIVSASKEKLTTEDSVRKALASARPDWLIENVSEQGNEWLVRLFKEEKISGSRRKAEVPPFLKKKDEESSEGPEDEAPSDEAAEESEESDESDDSGDSDDGDSGGDPQALVGELKKLLPQVEKIIHQIVDKHQETSDKLDKAKDALGDEGAGLGAEGPPVPPGLDAGPSAGPGGPMPKAPTAPPGPPRRPGVPSGGAGRPGMPSAFTNRRTEVITHSGVDQKGQKISLVAAAAELDSDPQFAGYEVVGLTENADGSYSAKLRLK